MTKRIKKSDLITEIVTLTRANGEEVFDTLTDKSSAYLDKLLKVIKYL